MLQNLKFELQKRTEATEGFFQRRVEGTQNKHKRQQFGILMVAAVVIRKLTKGNLLLDPAVSAATLQRFPRRY